jgi:transposase
MVAPSVAAGSAGQLVNKIPCCWETAPPQSKQDALRFVTCLGPTGRRRWGVPATRRHSIYYALFSYSSLTPTTASGNETKQGIRPRLGPVGSHSP